MAWVDKCGQTGPESCRKVGSAISGVNSTVPSGVNSTVPLLLDLVVT
jgi:hypothetical protein